MKKLLMVLFIATLIIGMTGTALTGTVKLRSKRVKIGDLPQTQFEATRYKHVSGQFAIVLDDPGDSVRIEINKPGIVGHEEGLKTPQGYIEQFKQTPQIYRFYNKKDGTVYGYLLYAGKIEWLASINRDGEIIDINVLGRSDDFP